jgi:hypothetical protein
MISERIGEAEVNRASREKLNIGFENRRNTRKRLNPRGTKTGKRPLSA